MDIHKFRIKPPAFASSSVNNEQWLLQCAPKDTLEKEYVIVSLMRGKRERDC